MNIKAGLQALKKHAAEEVRIHKEILKEAQGDAKHLIRKHVKDTVEIHKSFWKELKKAAKSK
jgi:hypothetical protein